MKDGGIDMDTMTEARLLTTQNIHELGKVQYTHILSKYKDIMQIIYIQSMMTNGMTLYDLQRIILDLNETTGNELETFGKFVEESKNKSNIGLGSQFVITHNDGEHEHLLLNKSLK